MRFRRLFPLVFLAVLSGSILALGLLDHLSLDNLRKNREGLQQFVATQKVVAALAYASAYTAVVALSLPGATIMTLAGGFLFGVAFGGTLAVLSATFGATLVFIVARSSVGGLLSRRASSFLQKMEAGFQADAFHYLLSLRLMPVLPFWSINLVAAVLGIPVGQFVAATAIGILPATFVFAAIGAGLDDVFATGVAIRPSDIVSPLLLIGLAGLGLLALLPAAVRRWMERRKQR